MPLPPESALAPDLLQLPYQRKKYLLTQAERAFYEVLLQALPPGYVVFTQVRIPALVYVPQGTTHRQSHYNRILAKTVDFVVCSTPALSPCLVIELDDSSHQRPDRQERDKLVDAVLTQAGLPIALRPVRTGRAGERGLEWVVIVAACAHLSDLWYTMRISFSSLLLSGRVTPGSPERFFAAAAVAARTIFRIPS